MSLAEIALRRLVWPAVDWKNRSGRMHELAALQRSQWHSRREREQRQLALLRETLAHAFATVPYYRDLWKRPAAVGSLGALAQLPVLTKEQIRRHAAALISDRYPVSQLVEARTGGSTGVALAVHFDYRCQQLRNAAALRSNAWAGWQPAMMAGALWGNPPVAQSLRERVRSRISERLVYLDTMELTAARTAAFLAELRRQRVRILFGHAHSLYLVARLAHDAGVTPPKLAGIVSTSMVLLAGERAFIERYFSCRVTDRYGCEEVGLIAAECERHAGLHVNDDHLVVEIVRADGAPAPPGETGQIVVTDLVNRGMPLIRYQVGDMSAWLEGDCACGRAMPRLARVQGRTADFLKTPDGRLVAGVSLVERTLTAIPGVEQMQIRQPALDRVIVRYVPAAGAVVAESGAALERAMTEALGSAVQVSIEPVPALAQDGNGKYRFCVCEC